MTRGPELHAVLSKLRWSWLAGHITWDELQRFEREAEAAEEHVRVMPRRLVRVVRVVRDTTR